MKTCTKCKRRKSLKNFGKHSGHKDGYATQCKSCCKKAVRKTYWYSVNKKRSRNRQLIRTYGITLDEYNQMFQKQQGCCAICGKHQSVLTHALSVDHNHITKEVRGLLCKNCNAALGQFGGDTGIDLLQRACAYLEGRVSH